MIVIWAFTTYPDTRGVVTANTETQLKTKTWAELGHWFNLCFFTREYFVLNATSLVSKDPDRERTWRIDMVPWSEKNPEAFQGMHNKGKRLLIIFDEASAIADIIWETVEGATTDADTQIIWLAFGNPTRNSGRFRECFAGGKHADYWHTTANRLPHRRRSPTKTRFEQSINAYGEDSRLRPNSCPWPVPPPWRYGVLLGDRTSMQQCRQIARSLLTHLPHSRLALTWLALVRTVR